MTFEVGQKVVHSGGAKGTIVEVKPSNSDFDKEPTATVQWADETRGEYAYAHLARVLQTEDRPFSEPKTQAMLLPSDAKERKNIPVATGVLDYFTAALIEVAKVSKAGNDQHNPGQPLHWARGKSTDQADTMIRHFLERGTLDTDGLKHSAKMAWRALAILQLELEAEGAPIARGVKE